MDTTTKTGRNAYLSADDALAYAQRAARRSLSGWTSGAADAEDMASEALTRLMSEYPVADGGAFGQVVTGWTVARIARRVRWLHREYTAGRTAAERTAAMPLSLDRANAADADGNAARSGAAIRHTLAMPKPEPTLSATGYGATPALLPHRMGTAHIPDGYVCRADADRLTVLPLDGGDAAYGDDAWRICRAAIARDNARTASGATRAVAAQDKHAETDARILRAVADAGSIAKAAAAMGMNINTAKAQHRAAKRRLAGLTTGHNRAK